MSLDFPPSVRSRIYFYFFLPRKGERDRVFALFFAPVPEKEILDFTAYGSIIRVFTVYCEVTSETCKQDHEKFLCLETAAKKYYNK